MMCDKKTWKEIFDERLESIEQELNNIFSYDSRENVFTINMSELAQSSTFKEYYESCEIDEFEDYEEVSPEWDETADKLFKSYYLPKIKEIVKEWESTVMYHAKHFDSRIDNTDEEPLSETFAEYFKTFWGEEDSKKELTE